AGSRDGRRGGRPGVARPSPAAVPRLPVRRARRPRPPSGLDVPGRVYHEIRSRGPRRGLDPAPTGGGACGPHPARPRVAPAGAVLGGRGASGGRRGQAEGRQARSAPAGVTEQEPPGTPPVPAVDVSVIVPPYQRRNLVARTVAALADQTVDPDRFEVIVVVDGSTDGTADRVRALDRPVHIRVIEQRNRGRAAAINAG